MRSLNTGLPVNAHLDTIHRSETNVQLTFHDSMVFEFQPDDFAKKWNKICCTEYLPISPLAELGKIQGR
jgi:hypothetical protein